jgi:leucyl-tRNA synthetase
VWIADYVIYGYGTGAIMAVPGHDERDWAFAKAMGLPIVEVISGGDVATAAHRATARWSTRALRRHCRRPEGTPCSKVIAWLEAEGNGKGEVTYKLRDWVFARQRYWGEPIPVLKDERREVVRALRCVDELPLELPDVDRATSPLGTGESPLARAKDWVRWTTEDGRRSAARPTPCPGPRDRAGTSCATATRTTPARSAAREKTDYWMPVDLYVGGAEHTVGHLLYARMWQRFLHEQGLVRDAEPFQKLRHQGMILGPSRTTAPASASCPRPTWTSATARPDKVTRRGAHRAHREDVQA